MRVSDILINVANNLGDSGMVQFPQSMLLSSIQEAYSLIVAETQCIERTANYPQVKGQVYYDFGRFIPDFCVLSAIFNYNTNRWIIPVSRRSMDQYRWDWENMEGEPRWFDVINWRYTCVMPHLSSATGGFLIFYKAKADQLTLDSVPSIPTQYIRILENYATADMFFANREFLKGRNYLTKYLADLPKIKKLVKSKASSDRINVLAPYTAMGPYAYTGDDMWQCNETPFGTVDGTNNLFTVIQNPNPSSTMMVFKNGQKLQQGLGYTLINNVLVFNTGFMPATGDQISVNYQVTGNPGGTISSGNWKNEIPLGAIDGANVLYTLSYFPSPINNMFVMKNGQKLILNTGYTISGNSLTITAIYILQSTDTLEVLYQY